MATYCRHPYIQLRARSSVSLRSGGSILQSKAGPFLASGEGSKFNFTVRVTDCYRKINGKWLITLEHISVPVDMNTGKPDLASKP
jgi:hypothetical protein